MKTKNKQNLQKEDDTFFMERHAWCPECDDITLHTMDLEYSTMTESSYRKYCNECLKKQKIQSQLDLDEVKVYWKHCSMPKKDWDALVKEPDLY